MIARQPEPPSVDNSDDGGWLTDASLQEAVSKGFIGTANRAELRLGYPATRAEVIQMLNRAMGLTGKGENRFKDVKSSDWFYDDFCRAYYISGFNDGTARPNDNIKREEITVIFARLLNLPPDYSPIYQFLDKDLIPTWAAFGVGGCVKARIFMGYPDGTFGPENNISRAEVIAALNKFVDMYRKQTNTLPATPTPKGDNSLDNLHT